MLGYQRWSWGTAAIAAMVAYLIFAGFVGIGRAEDQEGMRLATQGLTEDIQLLGKWLHQDLSQYPVPKVVVMTPAEFLDFFAEQKKKEGVYFSIEKEGAASYFSCEAQRIYISARYRDDAVREHIPPDDMFFMARYHELYHWALCSVFGLYRHYIDSDPAEEMRPHAIAKEEFYVIKMSRRYAAYRQYMRSRSR